MKAEEPRERPPEEAIGRGCEKNVSRRLYAECAVLFENFPNMLKVLNEHRTALANHGAIGYTIQKGKRNPVEDRRDEF